MVKFRFRSSSSIYCAAQACILAAWVLHASPSRSAGTLRGFHPRCLALRAPPLSTHRERVLGTAHFHPSKGRHWQYRQDRATVEAGSLVYCFLSGWCRGSGRDAGGCSDMRSGAGAPQHAQPPPRPPATASSPATASATSTTGGGAKDARKSTWLVPRTGRGFRAGATRGSGLGAPSWWPPADTATSAVPTLLIRTAPPAAPRQPAAAPGEDVAVTAEGYARHCSTDAEGNARRAAAITRAGCCGNTPAKAAPFAAVAGAATVAASSRQFRWPSGPGKCCCRAAALWWWPRRQGSGYLDARGHRALRHRGQGTQLSLWRQVSVRAAATPTDCHAT